MIIRIIGIFLLLPAVDDISFNEKTLSVSDRKKLLGEHSAYRVGLVQM